MEEYTEREEETVRVSQAKIEKEERAEAKAEPKQPMEETRKRKMGAKETGAEHSEGKESDWVLELAFVSWRDKLQHIDFIGERGFSRWISSFQEIVEKRGWLVFYEH